MADMIYDDMEDEGLANTDPRLVSKLQALSDALVAKGYNPINVTGGWRSVEHQKALYDGEFRDSWHLYGRAIDFVAEDVPDEIIENYAAENNLYALKHDVGNGLHWHFNTIDDEEDDTPPVFDSLNALGAAAEKQTYQLFDLRDAPKDTLNYAPEEDEDKIDSTLEAAYESFMQGASDTGFWSLVGLARSRFFNSGQGFKIDDDGKFEWKLDEDSYKITDEDIEYVKEHIPNDPARQEFILRQAIDRQELEYLTSRVELEKKRAQKLEEWKQENESYLKAGIVGLSGFAGGLADPMNIAPMGRAITGARAALPALTTLAKKTAGKELVEATTKALTRTAGKEFVATLTKEEIENAARAQMYRAMLPVSEAVAGASMRNILGEGAIANIERAMGISRKVGQRIAEMAASGGEAVLGMSADVGLRNATTGQETSAKEYAIAAGSVFVLGSTLNLAGQLYEGRKASAELVKAINQAAKAEETILAKAAQFTPEIKMLPSPVRKAMTGNSYEKAKALALAERTAKEVKEDFEKQIYEGRASDSIYEIVRQGINEKRARKGEEPLKDIDETKGFFASKSEKGWSAVHYGNPGEASRDYVYALHNGDLLPKLFDSEALGKQGPEMVRIANQFVDNGNLVIPENVEGAKSIIEKMHGIKVGAKDAFTHIKDGKDDYYVVWRKLSNEEQSGLLQQMIHNTISKDKKLSKEYEKLLAALERTKKTKVKEKVRTYDKNGKPTRKTINKTEESPLTPHEKNKLIREFFGKVMAKLGKVKFSDRAAARIQNMNDATAAKFNAVKSITDNLSMEDAIAKQKADDALALMKKSMTKEGFKEYEQNVYRAAMDELEYKNGMHWNSDGSVSFGGATMGKDSFFHPSVYNDISVLENFDYTNAYNVYHGKIRVFEPRKVSKEAPVAPEVAERQAGETVEQFLDRVKHEVLEKADEDRGEVWKKLPEFTHPILQKISSFLDQGYVGTAVNSASKTMRGLVGSIWHDPRGRKLEKMLAMDLETAKMVLTREMLQPYIKYIQNRMAHFDSVGKRLKGRFSEAANAEFDELIIRAYDAKYGGNTAGGFDISDFDDYMLECVENLHEFREKELSTIQNAGSRLGSVYDGIISKSWKPVDNCFTRKIDPQKLLELRAKTQGNEDKLLAGVVENIKRYAKRDAVKAKLLRDGGKEVSDEAVEAYISKNAESTAREWLTSRDKIFDPLDEANIKDKEFGDMPNLKNRLPVDTSGRTMIDLGDGNTFMFSFDESLRYYNTSMFVPQQVERMAGDASAKALFGSLDNFNAVVNQAREELAEAVARGEITKSAADAEIKNFVNGINELRGMRAAEDTMTPWKAYARLALNTAYAKYGANFGLNQIAETGMVMAYAGLKHIFSAFRPIQDIVMNCAYGKDTMHIIREADQHMFGQALEAQIFGLSFGDVSTRMTLEGQGLVARGLRGANDLMTNLGKITSKTSFLQSMTESQYKACREQCLIDLFTAAYEGLDKVGSFIRNPLSDAKLQGAGMTHETLDNILAGLRKYSTYDANAQKVTSFDLAGFLKDDPKTAMEMQNFVYLAAERAIQEGQRTGSRNLIKNMNTFARLALQFKDFSLRAINGQTMRALNAHDVDDAAALALSTLTNVGVYAARTATVAAFFRAVGLTGKAAEYENRMLNEKQLIRAAITRTGMLSMGIPNDVAEILNPQWGTVRTTVNNKPLRDRPREGEDILKDFVTQMPAVKEGLLIPYEAGRAVKHWTEDDFVQRDMQAVLHMIPMANYLFMPALFSKAAENLPKKHKRKPIKVETED